jgi:hypothetical protein
VDRRIIRDVMAGDTRRWRTSADSRAIEARSVEEKAGGGDQRPPQSEFRASCALTYMNASSGENLSTTVL